MKLIFSHENRIIVELAKGILNENGVDAFIKNEFIAGGAGDLSPINTWPELWVSNAADASFAKTLVDVLSKPSNEGRLDMSGLW